MPGLFTEIFRRKLIHPCQSMTFWHSGYCRDIPRNASRFAVKPSARQVKPKPNMNIRSSQTGPHLLEVRNKPRRCKHCKNKTKRMCPTCNVQLHDNCFGKYHRAYIAIKRYRIYGCQAWTLICIKIFFNLLLNNCERYYVQIVIWISGTLRHILYY